MDSKLDGYLWTWLSQADEDIWKLEKALAIVHNAQHTCVIANIVDFDLGWLPPNYIESWLHVKGKEPKRLKKRNRWFAIPFPKLVLLKCHDLSVHVCRCSKIHLLWIMDNFTGWGVGGQHSPKAQNTLWAMVARLPNCIFEIIMRKLSTN